MVRTLTAFGLACALAMATAPAYAAILTLPFVGDIEHPDMDPFHVVHPETAAAPAAAAPAPKKHHRMKKKTKKKAV